MAERGTGPSIAGRAAVVVLGDLGRSPRMLAHALALLRQGHAVDLVGYTSSEIPRELTGHPCLSLHPLVDPLGPATGSVWPWGRAIRGIVRLVALAAQLAFRLVWTVARPSVILVQTPPSLPTLPVAIVAARLRGARLAIDWHNHSDAMLGLAWGAGHPIVRLARALDGRLGRRADVHLCVSVAMARELEQHRGQDRVHVLPDLRRWTWNPAWKDQGARLLERVLGAPRGPERAVIVSGEGPWTTDRACASRSSRR